MCPTPNPQLIDRKHCAYCNLIENVREHYNSKKSNGKEKSYDEGFNDGWHDGWQAAIDKLKELKGL